MKRISEIVIAACAALFLFSAQLSAQDGEFESKKYQYAERSGRKLEMEVLRNPAYKGRRPAIIFFFGGGWNQGSPTQFLNQAKMLVDRGMVAVMVDYRTFQSAGTTPFECVADAKSAVRYVKAHAKELGIHPKKIVTSGGSAGGHLAAACAYVEGFDDPSDDLSISPVPSALVLFNPVVDNGPKGYGYERISSRYPAFSPIENIRNGNALPAIFMVGSKDDLIPVSTAERFKKLTEENGAECVLKIYEGQKHGFFNYGKSDHVYFHKTMADVIDFLEHIGYLR